METVEKKNFDDLEFLRITQPEVVRRIPRHLFEQIKDNTFNIDKIYEFAPSFVKNPTTWLYVLIDKKFKIKGIFWAYINLLSERIQVNILSVDKEYQDGTAIKKTLEFIRSWQGQNENLPIEFITTRPDNYEKRGFVRSNKILMEAKNKEQELNN